MWDVGGDSFEFFDGGAQFLQHADLSLDEPDLEKVLEDLGALDLSPSDGGPLVESETTPQDGSNN